MKKARSLVGKVWFGYFSVHFENTQSADFGNTLSEDNWNTAHQSTPMEYGLPPEFSGNTLRTQKRECTQLHTLFSVECKRIHMRFFK